MNHRLRDRQAKVQVGKGLFIIVRVTVTLNQPIPQNAEWVNLLDSNLNQISPCKSQVMKSKGDDILLIFPDGVIPH